MRTILSNPNLAGVKPGSPAATARWIAPPGSGFSDSKRSADAVRAAGFGGSAAG
jgi:hypothetical protein